VDYRLEDIEKIIDAQLLSRVSYDRKKDGDDEALLLADSTAETVYSLVYPLENDPRMVVLQHRFVSAPIARESVSEELLLGLATMTSEFGLALEPHKLDKAMDFTATSRFRYSRNSEEFRFNLAMVLEQVRDFHQKYGDDLKRLFGDL
jgi:hypothetical protein